MISIYIYLFTYFATSKLQSDTEQNLIIELIIITVILQIYEEKRTS